jgi:hypothetical protein
LLMDRQNHRKKLIWARLAVIRVGQPAGSPISI